MVEKVLLLSIFFFAALTVAGLLLLLLGRFGKRDLKLQARLNQLLGHHPKQGTGDADERSILREEYRGAGAILSFLRSAFPAFSDLGLKLEQAGLAMTQNRFIQIWAGSTVAGGLSGAAIPLKPLGPFLGLLAGSLLPFLLLKIKKRKREAAFEKQFPETLRLMATSLKAGHTIHSSIWMLGEELPPPVSVEFKRVFEESNLGVKIEDALKGMLKRVDNADLRFFVSSIMIQRETGGNLAVILEQIDSLIRERFRIRRQVKTYTASGRMTGVVLGVMPVGMASLLTIINPQYMAPLWRSPTGRTIAIGAVLLQGLGFLIIRRIVNIRI